MVELMRCGDDPCLLRSLLTSWHSTFVSLQQVSQTLTDEGKRRTFLLHQSKCYRADLEAFLHQASIATSSASPAAAASFPPLSTLRVMETAKTLWHLYETIHIDPFANVTAQLLDWLHRFSEPPAYYSDFLAAEAAAEAGAAPPAVLPADRAVHSAAYWSALARLLACGRAADAIRLLAANTVLDAQVPGAREQLIALVVACPTFAANAAVAELAELLGVELPDSYAAAVAGADDAAAAGSALEQQFALWQRDVAAARVSPALAARPELRPVFALLSGEPAALDAATETWQELLCASLAFRQPWAERETIAWLADHSCKAKGVVLPGVGVGAGAGAGAAGVFDATVYAVLSTDALLSLRAIDAAVRLPWLTAHLADLLAHVAQTTLPTTVALATDAAARAASVSAGASPLIPRAAFEHARDPGAPLDLREHWVVAYAASLIGTPLWQLAVGYFENCLVQGRPYIALLVARTAPTSAAVVERLLALCDRYGLPDERRAVCATVSARHARSGRPAAAAHWAARGGLGARVAAIGAAAAAAAVDAAAAFTAAVGATVACPAVVPVPASALTSVSARVVAVPAGFAAWSSAAAARVSPDTAALWSRFTAARTALAAVAAAGAGASAEGESGWSTAAAGLEAMWRRLDGVGAALSSGAGVGVGSGAAAAAAVSRACAGGLRAAVSVIAPATATATAAATPDPLGRCDSPDSSTAAVAVTPPVQAYVLRTAAQLITLAATAETVVAPACVAGGAQTSVRAALTLAAAVGTVARGASAAPPAGSAGVSVVSLAGVTVLLRALTALDLAAAAALPPQAILAVTAGADDGNTSAAGGEGGVYAAGLGLEGVSQVLAAQLAVAMQDASQ
jgi:hypothetical protein